MEFDLENPLTELEQHQSNTILSLFESESDHMPSADYIRNSKSKDFDVSVRQQAISLILHAQCCSNTDPFLPYLAVNYLDRFISRHKLPQGKQWILKLISISCLSLAAKMMNLEISVDDFQGEDQFIFDSQTIQRMELLILGALEWRLRSITPFSFLHFFMSMFNLQDPPLLKALKARATDILFKSQTDISIIEFKPSIVAASALLIATNVLFPLQFPCFRDTISSCQYVNKERLVDCCTVMQDLVMDDFDMGVRSSSNTPVNVLDRHWSSSSESELTATTETIRSVRSIIRRNTNDF
ncbi:hypothetical protein ACHQM5_003509 [Ranunculus cassubicifolius]